MRPFSVERATIVAAARRSLVAAVAAAVLLSGYSSASPANKGSASADVVSTAALSSSTSPSGHVATAARQRSRIAVSAATGASAPPSALALLNRVVCDNHNDPTSIYQCEVTDVSGAGATTSGRIEGQALVAAPLDEQINQVYSLLGDTYDYYKLMFNGTNGNPYDLTDNIGFRDENNPQYARVLSATINACGAGGDDTTCVSDNAFWQPADNSYGSPSAWYVGGTMQIGAGLANLSDVIAHEVQHGVTAATAGLTYQGQSGAINESLSDIFGEAVDHYRQVKYNEPTDDWTIGEGRQWPYAAGETAPFLRSMKDPLNLPEVNDPQTLFPTSKGQAANCTGWQPDKMSSPCWDTDPKNDDAGGVHTNSGVGNHLAYLIAVGGQFNGRVVAGLGEDEAMQLWWVTLRRINRNETYYDLGRHLWSSCLAIQSSSTISRVLPAGSCDATVKQALLATQVSARSVSWGSSIPKTVTSSAKITLRATVNDARRVDARSGLPRQTVAFQRLVGKVWTNMATASTSSSGTAAVAAVITRSGYYRYVVIGAAASPQLSGPAVFVTVRTATAARK